ncbi:MAG: ABC transporter permease, partial [Tepidiformaceae bacterium]
MTVIAVNEQPRERWHTRKARESMLFGVVWRLVRNPQGMIAVGGLMLLVIVAVGAGVISRSDPLQGNASAALLAPSWSHPFGTDQLRRDLLARTLYGLRTSLAVAIGSVALGAAAGSCIGFIAGYAGRVTENVAMRIVDALLAFPGLLTALAILTILGPGSRNVAIAIAIFNVPVFARLARAQMIVEKHRDYVQASRSLGAGPSRIIFVHIVRNVISPLLTQMALAMAAAVIIAASLNYLGLGQRPPEPSL